MSELKKIEWGFPSPGIGQARENPHRLNLDRAMQNAIQAVELMTPAPPLNPGASDLRLITLRNLYRANLNSLQEMNNAIAYLERIKLSVVATVAECKCAIELRELELGIEPKDGDSDDC